MPTRLLLEGADVEQLLARVRTEHGPEARIVKAERVRSGGVGGFFAREHFEVTVEVASELDDAPSASADAADAPASVEDLLAAADASERASEQAAGPVVRAWSPPRAEPPSGRRPLSTDGRDFAEVLAALTATAGAESPPAPAPAPAPAPPRAPAPRSASLAPETVCPNADIAALSRLGVPDQVLVHIGPGDVVRQLHRALRRLPAAPRPRLPHGGVVAVVGPRRHAVRAAAALAEQLHVDPSAVLHAGTHDPGPAVPARRRLTGLGDARRRAALARAKELPVVVVVEADVDPQDHAWAQELLDAVAPEQIWAVVDATRKTADTRSHLRALAGQTGVDALAVYGAAATADPASVLALGSPVGLLDAAPATPGAWTALLVDLLEDNG